MTAVIPGGGPVCDMGQVRRILDRALGTQVGPPLSDEQAEQVRCGMAGLAHPHPSPWQSYLLGLRHGVQYALTDTVCSEPCGRSDCTDHGCQEAS
jgi:hypothetical protein